MSDYSALPYIGPIIDGISNIYGQDRANKQNEKLAQDQRDWQLKMWERQNKYNHPTQAAARMRAAGMNPALLYTKGASVATGNAGEVGGYDRAEAENVTRGLSTFKDMVHLKNTAVQTDNVQAQTDLTNQAAQNKALEAVGLAIENKRKARYNNLEDKTFDHQVDQAKYKAQSQQYTAGANYEDFIVKLKSRGARVDKIIQDARKAKLEGNNKALQNEWDKWRNELSSVGLTPSDSKVWRFAQEIWDWFTRNPKDAMNSINKNNPWQHYLR